MKVISEVFQAVGRNSLSSQEDSNVELAEQSDVFKECRNITRLLSGRIAE